MTLYLLFEDLQHGKITLSSRLKVSRFASKQAPSKLGLRKGSSIRVKDAIGSLVTKSANDAAVVIAENLSGSVSAFARRMTTKARHMGMTRTTFHNPSGLPDRRQKTTARDMATLALRIQRDFPTYYRYFSMRSFRYGKRAYRNHNRLLGRVKGVDGIKTGYTRAAGFNLTTSARRGNKRIVAVVMGASSGRSRNKYMSSLVNRMFRTRRLTSGKHLALVAGKPPGYKRPAARIARLQTAVPPKPRRKPLVDGSTIATIAHGAAVQSLASGPKTSATVNSEDSSAGATFVSVQVPSKSNEAEAQNISTIFKQSAADAAMHKLIKTAVLQAADQTDSLKKTSEDAKPARSIDVKDNIDTDFASHLRSWNIQIGAYPTRKSATSRLDRAKQKARRSLTGKASFTMPTQKNGKTLYRARFSGFNRTSARRACKLLNRKGLGCFALAPRG